MTGQPFTLLVDIPLKPGRADEFMALLNDVFEAMKGEETFVSATALRGTEDPDTILLCENWIDRENFMSVQLKRPYRDRYEATARASPLAPQIVLLRADPFRPIAVVAKGGVPPTISNGTSACGTRRTLSGRMGYSDVIPGQRSGPGKSANRKHSVWLA
jgi:quinol monooxygenase YgiN